jgi:protease-4
MEQKNRMNETENSNPALAEAGAAKTAGWERELLEKLAFAALREQRARRRWGIFFKFVFLAAIAIGFALIFDFDSASMESAGNHTALI